jgi:hypothetical protein
MRIKSKVVVRYDTIVVAVVVVVVLGFVAWLLGCLVGCLLAILIIGFEEMLLFDFMR